MEDKNDISKSEDYGKFVYVMNALHYSLWLTESYHTHKLNKYLRHIVDSIMYLIFPKNKIEERLKNRKNEIKKLNRYVSDKERGIDIISTNHSFGYLYSSYPGIISFILAAIYINYHDNYNPFILIGIVTIPILFCYIPLYRALYAKNRYLRYYQYFEKQNTEWIKKWKRYLIVFIIGAVAADLVGVAFMWYILF